MTETAKGKHYPEMPPMLEGETDFEYANRLLSKDGYPYDHRRFRNCALGWHADCSDSGCECKCPCHDETLTDSLMGMGEEGK